MMRFFFEDLMKFKSKRNLSCSDLHFTTHGGPTSGQATLSS
jgi:hypothetical protein